MNHTHTSTGAEAPCLPPPPPCPVCGGLECLCRPRFFAGQLLSEEDLRALDHYIIEKNKLHNRYLHGWGVVCGLEVVCHECKGWVTIRSGYAIDPCGNDIIVCEDYSFDLCAKIRECCDRKRRDWECEPMWTHPEDCKDVEKCWYVTLRYREFESRGITALKHSEPCRECGCGCGAAPARTDCHCGCHGSSGNGHRKTKNCAPTARRAAPQCEPTRLCESYVVEVAPAPPEKPPTHTDLFHGTFANRFAQCRDAAKDLQVPSLTQESLDADYSACLQFKQAVWEFLMSHPVTHCGLIEQVRNVSFPPPPVGIIPIETANDYRQQLQSKLTELKSFLDQYSLECFCSAILPRCPGEPCDPRVILACVTVKGDDCRIVDICNLHGRRFVFTWPNFLYWLSISPLAHQILEGLCCGERESSPLTHGALQSRAARFTAAPDEEADPTSLLRSLVGLFAQAAEGAAFNDLQPAARFAPHIGGKVEDVTERLQSAEFEVRREEVKWPAEVWVLHQLLQPLLGLSKTGAVAYTSRDTVMGFGAAPLTELRDQVARLSQRVEEQQRTIARLSPQPPPG